MTINPLQKICILFTTQCAHPISPNLTLGISRILPVRVDHEQLSDQFQWVEINSRNPCAYDARVARLSTAAAAS